MKQDFGNLSHTFWVHTNRSVQCSKNYFNFFLPEEAGAFGNNMKKKPQKPHPKLKKYMYYIFKENICSACNPMQVVAFCKSLLIS